MTHVILATKLRPELATQAVLAAQGKWGFGISMVQADNGPEFGRYFEQQMRRAGITTRHSRLHRPNDNAHIEGFNRTVQEESYGVTKATELALITLKQAMKQWQDEYNHIRRHSSCNLSPMEHYKAEWKGRLMYV